MFVVYGLYESIADVKKSWLTAMLIKLLFHCSIVLVPSKTLLDNLNLE